MVMMICYLIGAKIAGYPQEIGCDENDAVDYFAAMEYDAYEIIKSENHSSSLIKEGKIIVFIIIYLALIKRQALIKAKASN